MSLALIMLMIAVLQQAALGSVKFEPGVRFKEIGTPVQTSSITIKYSVDMTVRHSLESTSEIDSLRHILIRGTENLNDTIIGTCDLMKEAHKQLGTHYESIVNKATLLRRKRMTNPLAFVGDILGWCCSIATKGDLSVTLENDVLIQDQLDNLFKSFDDVVNVTRRNTYQWAEFASSIHGKFKTIDDELTKILDSRSIMTDWFSHVILRSISSVTEMVVKLLMAERLDQIYNSCTQNQIPLSVIPPDMLLTEIELLNQQLRPRAEVAITSVSALYKLSIVNCIFKENILEIIVKYPVRSVKSNWKIVDVLPIPFAYQNHVCKILPAPSMILSNDTHIRLLSDQQRTDCLQNSVCPLPRATVQSPTFGKCLEQLYFGRISDYINLNYTCKFSCEKNSGTEVVDLNNNNYVIVHPRNELFIKCPANELKIDPVPIGASKLNIPCDCTLHSNNVILIESQFPCDPRLTNVVSKTTVLPALWSDQQRLSPIAGSKFDFTFVDVNSILSRNLSLVLPDFVTITDMPKPTAKKVSSTLPTVSIGLYAFCSLLLLLQIVLFILVGILFKINCCKNNVRFVTKKEKNRRHSATSSDIELDLFKRSTARL